MKKIFSILITLVVISGGSALAQENIFSLTYSMSAPAGNTAGFVGDASFRGGAFDYRHFINPKMSVGFSVGYHRFYQDNGFTTQPLPGGDGHISGNNYRYVNEFPLMLTYHYYFGHQGGVRPYVGGGIGAAHYEYVITSYSIHYTKLYELTTDKDTFSSSATIALGSVKELFNV